MKTKRERKESRKSLEIVGKEDPNLEQGQNDGTAGRKDTSRKIVGLEM